MNRLRLNREFVLGAIAFLLPFLTHWRLWTTNLDDRLYIYQDMSESIYPLFVFMIEQLQNGSLPLWNWHVYSGMYQGGSFVNWQSYLLNLPLYIGLVDVSTSKAFNLYLLFHLSLGAVAFYLLARSFDLRPEICFVGATAYSFSLRAIYGLITAPGNLYVFAWAPFTFWAYSMFQRDRKPRFALLGGLGWFFCMLSLNPMNLVPLGLLLCGWVIHVLISIRRDSGSDSFVASTKWVVVSLILSLGLVANAAIPIAETTSIATRNATGVYDWAKLAWADEKDLDLLVRNLFLPEYGSGLYISFGTVAMLLFFYGLYAASTRLERKVRNASVVMGLTLFGGSVVPIYDLAYLVVPLVARTNSIDRGSTAFVIPAILVCLFAIRKLSREEGGKLAIGYVPMTGLVLFVGALLYVFYLPSGENHAVLKNHRNIVLHTVLFAGLGVLILGKMRTSLNKTAMITALIIVHTLDVTSLTRFFFTPSMKTERELSTSSLALEKSPYLEKHGFSKRGGNSIARPRIYDAKNNQVMLQSLDNVAGYYQFQPYRVSQAFLTSGFSDSYLFRGAHPFDDAKEVSKRAVNLLYDLPPENRGRVFGVPRAERKKDRDESLVSLARSDFDPTQTIILEDWDAGLAEYPGWVQLLYRYPMWVPSSKYEEYSEGDGVAINESVELIHQTTNRAVFRVHGNNQFIFFSNSWHPGWVAFANGKRVEVQLANYTFIGLELPDVKETVVIEFVFSPAASSVGNLISMVALALFVVCWNWDRVRHRVCRY